MDTLRKRGELPPERSASRPALCEGANFAPENEYEIDGEQKKLGLDGVAVFCDRIDEIIRNGINEERGGEEQPPARTARQNEKKSHPAAERQRPEFPRLPPFPALIEQRCAIPEPPGAMERQVAEFGRILADKSQAVFLVIVEDTHLSHGRIFFELCGIGVGMLSAVTHAVAEVVVAEVKFKPEVAAKENRPVEDDFVADQPGRNERCEKNAGQRHRSEPGPEGAMVHKGRVKKSKRHDAEQSEIGQRDHRPQRAQRDPQFPRALLRDIERDDEGRGKKKSAGGKNPDPGDAPGKKKRE